MLYQKENGYLADALKFHVITNFLDRKSIKNLLERKWKTVNLNHFTLLWLFLPSNAAMAKWAYLRGGGGEGWLGLIRGEIGYYCQSLWILPFSWTFLLQNHYKVKSNLKYYFFNGLAGTANDQFRGLSLIITHTSNRIIQKLNKTWFLYHKFKFFKSECSFLYTLMNHYCWGDTSLLEAFPSYDCLHFWVLVVLRLRHKQFFLSYWSQFLCFIC